MKQILTLGIAALGTVLLAQPVHADDHRGGGRGVGGRASAPRSAPQSHSVAHAIAPQHFAQQAAPGPRFTPQNFVQRSAPAPHFAVQQSPRTTVAPSITRTRPRFNTPSVAFGGTANTNNAIVSGQNARHFGGGFSQAASGDSRAPMEISRDWNHGGDHVWHHHHYRWYNGDWVLFDGGYPYGYGNPFYGYGSYDQEPAPAVMYHSSASLAASVQDQLARQGYDPGPPDGVVGPQTRDAILDFQNDRHLPVTGEIDDPLLRALGLE